MQQDGERIVISRRVDLPTRANKPRNAVGEPEQMHRLVQQVRAQVVDGCSPGDDLVLPLVSVCRGLDGTVSVKVGVVFHHAAQRAVLDQLGQRHEVGIPAAVCPLVYLVHMCTPGEEWIHTLVNSQELVVLLGNGIQLICFLRGWRKRLFTDD